MADSYTPANLQVSVRFQPGTSLNCYAQGVQFCLRDLGWRTAEPDKSNNAGKLEYGKTIAPGNADKHIARKKWKTDQLLAVFPPLEFFVRGQKRLDAPLNKMFGHGLLMPRARVYRMPD